MDELTSQPKNDNDMIVIHICWEWKWKWLPFADTYDAVVISGGMGEGHIPCSGMEELCRIVKAG